MGVLNRKPAEQMRPGPTLLFPLNVHHQKRSVFCTCSKGCPTVVRYHYGVLPLSTLCLKRKHQYLELPSKLSYYNLAPHRKELP